MNAINVKTTALRRQAEELNREAARYNRRFAELQEVIAWVRRQDFKGAEEMCSTLKKQNIELEQQKCDFLLLSRALYRIGDKYDRTEQELVEAGERNLLVSRWGIRKVDISWVYLKLYKIGLQMSDE